MIWRQNWGLDNLREIEYSQIVRTKLMNLRVELATDYRYIFVNHNYFIYRYDDKRIIIVNMFNENEDFIMKLFGISGRTDESLDYWGE